MGLAALAILAKTHSLHAQCKGDLNNDQTVDVQDLLTLLVHFGECCKILITSYPSLHLSEIHYTPNSAQGNDSDWEFLELYNPNVESVALAGWQLANAVALTFQTTDTIPGLGFFTVARNLDTLLTVLPNGAH